MSLTQQIAKHFRDVHFGAENALWEDFTDMKFGNYYRNLHGIIEHLHYHLGQVVIIKKLLVDNPGEKTLTLNSSI